MTSRRKSRARGLIALAIKIAPPERRGWFEAMAAELDHVPEAELSLFAAGSVLAAVRERIVSPRFLHGIARGVLIGGAMGWAVMNIRFAGRMSVTDALVLEAVGYSTALLFVVGALATARFGYRATISLATPLIAVLAAVAISIRLGSVPAPLADLYFALILEDLAVLMMALVVAVAASRLISAQREFG